MSSLCLPKARSAHINIEICTDTTCPGPCCRHGNTRRHFLAVSESQTWLRCSVMEASDWPQCSLEASDWLLLLLEWNIRHWLRNTVWWAPGLPLSAQPKWERSEVVWWNDIPDFPESFETEKPWGIMMTHETLSLLLSSPTRGPCTACHQARTSHWSLSWNSVFSLVSYQWQHQNSVITLEQHLNNVTTQHLSPCCPSKYQKQNLESNAWVSRGHHVFTSPGIKETIQAYFWHSQTQAHPAHP